MPWAEIIRGLLEGLASVFKSLFGISSAPKDTISDVPPTTPKPKSDDELLRELGVIGSAHDPDHGIVLDRAADRDALRDRISGNANEGAGKRDGEMPPPHR